MKANMTQAFSPAEQQRSTALLSLIQYSMQRGPSDGHGKFRPLLSYDRQWSGDFSEDVQGQVLSALGTCARHGLQEDFAHDMFIQSMKPAETFDTLLGIALALDGCTQYLIRFVNDAPVVALRKLLTDRLLQRYRETNSTTTTDAWQWFAPNLAVCNATVAHSLISVGADTDNAAALSTGLTALAWLGKSQVSSDSTGQFFVPFSSYSGTITQANLAQSRHLEERPSEVQAMVAAALEAHRRTSEPRWMGLATLAMDWFLGRNCVGRICYDSKSGGAYDGIFAGSVNKNEGADSTLSFLLALTELQCSSRF
jgi:hypothetical protein